MTDPTSEHQSDRQHARPDGDALRESVVAALRTVQDPEIPINLYDLGLIYDLDLGEGGAVAIRMTLTTPNCPVAESMPSMVRRAVEGVDGVGPVSVELTFEPAWTPEAMSDRGKMQLEMMGLDWRKPVPAHGPTSLTIGRSGRPGPPARD